jgi:hypothetical protein
MDVSFVNEIYMKIIVVFYFYHNQVTITSALYEAHIRLCLDIIIHTHLNMIYTFYQENVSVWYVTL